MSITLRQHIEKIKRIRREVLDADTPVRLASGSALALLSERIFQDGKSVTGQTFQYNNTEPLYVNPKKTFGDTAGLKPPTGKTGKTKFKSGKSHKTTWVESYKELRRIVGRESNKVNWVANGDLKSDIENNSTLTTRKIQNAEYKISSQYPENIEKLRGLINKYASVFQLSESEKQAYRKAFGFEYLKLLRNKLA